MTPDTILARGDFRIVSYEWGRYLCGYALRQRRQVISVFRDYAENGCNLLPMRLAGLRSQTAGSRTGKQKCLCETALPACPDEHGSDDRRDDQSQTLRQHGNLQPIISIGIDHIMSKQYRLSDGTLARNRPQPNTLWLDDMFHGSTGDRPDGKLTGEKKYYDERGKQVLALRKRMSTISRHLHARLGRRDE